MSAIPVLMVRNEEYWIERVLAPLLAVCGRAVVGDTGSTDRTPELARALPGVHLIEMGALGPQELGQARRELGRYAARLGAEWILQVDGDELYQAAALRAILDEGMPAGTRAGFTLMLSLDRDETGELWEMADLFNRLALMPVGCRWSGEYPFEVPEVFNDPGGFHYFQPPAGLRYHAVHLHRLDRSPADGEVVYRRQKRFQFSMQDKRVPRTAPFDLEGWLSILDHGIPARQPAWIGQDDRRDEHTGDL